MKLEVILRWIIIAIVLIVAVSLLSVILEIGAAILHFAVRVLLILFLVAIVLRFAEHWRG